MNQIKLMVASPIYGNCDPRFFSALRPLEKAGATIAIKLGDSLVARARNNLAADFLASDCTHLLWIDSDILFDYEHVERLLSHEVDVVGGLYAIKDQDRPRWCCNLLPGGKLKGDLAPAQETGTGFLLTTRRVYEALQEDHPERFYTCDFDKVSKFDFFPTGVRNGRYLSEDWAFCWDCRAAGFEVWVDSECKVDHLGIARYPLDIDKIALRRVDFGPDLAADLISANPEAVIRQCFEGTKDIAK